MAGFDPKGLLEGLGDLKTPDLELPKFNFDIPEVPEVELPDFVGGLANNFGDLHDELDEPFEAKFTVSGIEAVQAGTAEAMSRLLEFRGLRAVSLPDMGAATPDAGIAPVEAKQDIGMVNEIQDFLNPIAEREGEAENSSRLILEQLQEMTGELQATNEILSSGADVRLTPAELESLGDY